MLNKSEQIIACNENCKECLKDEWVSTEECKSYPACPVYLKLKSLKALDQLRQF